MLYIFNTTICPSVGLTYHTRFIAPDHARRLLTLAEPQVTSAVGHQATAELATEVLGREVSVSRITAEMSPGDMAICFKLRVRAQEGAILDRSQVEAAGYDIVLMEAVERGAP